jgi:hypothetical protein
MLLISPMRATRSAISSSLAWIVQVMKLLIMQSSPASRHFLPVKFK